MGKMRGKWGSTSPSSKDASKRPRSFWTAQSTPQNTKVIGMTQGYGELGSQQSGIETHRGDSEAVTTLQTLLGSLPKSHWGRLTSAPHLLPHALLYVLHRQFTVCVPTGGQCKLSHTASEHAQKAAELGRIQRKHTWSWTNSTLQKLKWESSNSQPGSAGWREDIHSKELSHHQGNKMCEPSHYTQRSLKSLESLAGLTGNFVNLFLSK